MFKQHQWRGFTSVSFDKEKPGIQTEIFLKFSPLRVKFLPFIFIPNKRVSQFPYWIFTPNQHFKKKNHIIDATRPIKYGNDFLN